MTPVPLYNVVSHLFWERLELVFRIHVLPDALHVVPVLHYAMLHRVSDRKKTSVLLSRQKGQESIRASNNHASEHCDCDLLSDSTSVLIPLKDNLSIAYRAKPRAWIQQTGCDLWHLQCCIPWLLIDCSVTHTPDLPSNFLPAQAGGLSLRPKLTEQVSAFTEPTVLSKDPPFLPVNWNNTFCLWLLGVVFPFYFFFNLFRTCNAYFSARLSRMLMRFIRTVSLSLCPLSFVDIQVLLCCRKWGQQKAADPMNVKIVLKAWNNPALITASWSLLSLHWYLDN